MNETPAAPAATQAGLSNRALFAGVFGSGMLLRVILGFVAYPGQGFSMDLGQFSSWAQAIAATGPGTFYATSGANYPPGYMYVLWVVGELAKLVGPPLGMTSASATTLLLKLPPILADAGVAALLYAAGSRWFGGRAGVVAAALYLFVPVTWYDSALWGQVDAAGALAVLAVIVALGEGWSVAALVLAVVAALVKPQAAIALVVVLPVLFRRHVLHFESTRDILALGGAAATAAVVGIALMLPFDITRFAPSSLASIPFVGQVVGYAGLFGSDSGQYSVLSANAFNLWALVGNPSLASIAGGSGSWVSDSTVVLGSLTAFQVGTTMLVATGLVIAMGLLLRDDRRAILLAVAVAAFAFYALPTRVHERYLFPFFAAGALLAAPYVGGAIAYVVTALLNAVNIHAVLGSGGLIGGLIGGPGGGSGRPGGPLGGAGIPGGRGGSGFGTSGSISLPFTDIARSEIVVTAVAVGQTLAFVALLGAWIVYAYGPLVRRQTHEPAPVTA